MDAALRGGLIGEGNWIAMGLPNATRKTLVGQTHDFDPTALGPVMKDFLSRLI